jgi:hypothetical protein
MCDSDAPDRGSPPQVRVTFHGGVPNEAEVTQWVIEAWRRAARGS